MNRYRKAFASCIFSLLFAVLAASCAFAQTRIHVLDVGQGLSVLVESQGHFLLYDGGDSNKSSYVVSYLKHQGVKSLDYVIASHYDSDHLNGVVGALNVFSVDQVLSPDYEAATRVFQSFERLIQEKKIPRKQPAVGDAFALGDAAVTVLAPFGTGYSDVNNYSIAVRIVDGSTSFLITGDAEAESEVEMIASGLPLESSV